MNDFEQWEHGNGQYLTEAVEWLRLRLDGLAGSTAEARSMPPTAAPTGKRGWFNLGKHETGESDEPVVKHATKAEREAAARMNAAAAAEPPPAIMILAQRFGLSAFGQEILLLCAAMEFDTRIPALCARAQADPTRPYPTFALALTLFDDPAWNTLAPQGPLRYWRLIEILQSGAQPLTSSPLRADERIVNYLKGLNYLDERLTSLLVPLEAETFGGKLPPSQQTIVENIVQRLRQAISDGRPPVIQLLGPDTLSKQFVAWHVASQLNLQLCRLPIDVLPAQAHELETLARLWQRESLLLPVVLYLDAQSSDETNQPAGQISPLQRFLALSNGFFFLETRDLKSDIGRPSAAFDVAKPTPSEQKAIWADVLDQAAADSPTRLAGQFSLNQVTIQQLAATVLAQAQGNGNHLHARLWEACVQETRPQIDLLAQPLDVRATWNEIVLPDEPSTLLKQITYQVEQRSKVYDEWGFRRKMNRGLGINALFAGESGTGKTMAAEVIANDLHLNLYRIDLSAVVSKYIGETEKNLRKLFDAAEDGGAILFFDEADALFGKRSEVKDSHDRYANIEINYLLQRMEAYRGLAILATNMKSALDQAFLRRLRFIVNFPFPGVEDRKRIWQKVFPPETQTEKLDVDRLARLNLTGGSIHNIALNAAFSAAHHGTPVTMPLILAAARAEFRKLERPVNEADFQWQEPKK